MANEKRNSYLWTMDGYRRRRKAKAEVPTDVSVLLQGVLGQSLLGEGMDAYRLAEGWPAIVGARMVQYLQFVEIQGDILVLRAASAPWKSEANLQKKAIIGACNAHLGKARLRDIRFV